MNLQTKSFSFEKSNGERIEGTFFYDEDEISEEAADKIIQNSGAHMDNRVFKKEAKCFFLPKAQADLLRQVWIPHKVEQRLAELANNTSFSL